MQESTERIRSNQATRRRRLCIVQPGANAVTETFIRAHHEQLPADVTVVYGLRPRLAGRKRWRDRLRRTRLKLQRSMARKPRDWEVTQLYLSALRRACPDVVLAEYGHVGTWVMEAARRMRLPLVVHFHGCDASDRNLLQDYGQAYRRMFRQAAAVIAVSKAMHRQLASLGAPAEKLHYNPYGVQCDQFAGADPATSKPVFVAVGRFVEKKAPHLTIMAFAEVNRLCRQTRLRMVGDGPLLPFCRELVARLGLTDAVTFLGAQPHSVVRQEMRNARAFVQHSIAAPSGDSEGTPVAILEASASGLPVVATRHAGIPDVVIEGETGLLVNEHDVRGMISQMQRLADGPALAGQLGSRARRHIQENFTLTKSINNLWAIIESCLRSVRPDDCDREAA